MSYDAAYRGWRACGYSVAHAQALAYAETTGDDAALDALLAEIKRAAECERLNDRDGVPS